jgi:drug/metabolite transporter (DMT)-like permease
MNPAMGLALFFSACSAAVGQILLKLGAQGRAGPLAMVNRYIFLGLCCYAFGLILWLYALRRLPLSTVYPFTALTLILVGALSAAVLGDRPNAIACAGYALVAAGLGVMWFASNSA